MYYLIKIVQVVDKNLYYIRTDDDNVFGNVDPKLGKKYDTAEDADAAIAEIKAHKNGGHLMLGKVRMHD